MDSVLRIGAWIVALCALVNSILAFAGVHVGSPNLAQQWFTVGAVYVLLADWIGRK